MLYGEFCQVRPIAPCIKQTSPDQVCLVADGSSGRCSQPARERQRLFFSFVQTIDQLQASELNLTPRLIPLSMTVGNRLQNI